MEIADSNSHEESSISLTVGWLVLAVAAGVLAIAIFMKPESSQKFMALVDNSSVLQAPTPPGTTLINDEDLALLKENQMALLDRLSRIEAAFGPVTGSIPQVGDNSLNMTLAPQNERRSFLASNQEGSEGSLDSLGEVQIISNREPSRDSLSLDISADPTLQLLAEEEPILVNQTVFGLELGAADSVSRSQEMWRTLSVRHRALLEPLAPIVSMRDTDQGTTEIMLIAGPVRNASDAARLCARLNARGQSCNTTVYDGQQLAMR